MDSAGFVIGRRCPITEPALSMSSLHAVIMAGGSGTRFWPASRAARPKQFLPLARGKALIAATVDRLAGLCEHGCVWVATNAVQDRALAQITADFQNDQEIS